jgi:hypothetical protein
MAKARPPITIDFKEVNDLLDEAGCDLHSVEKIYEIVRSRIEAAPPDQRPALYVQFADLASDRAAMTQQVLEAHIAAAKSAFKI